MLEVAEALLKVENNVVATGREPVVYRVDQISGNSALGRCRRPQGLGFSKPR